MQKFKYTVFDALVNFYRRRSVNFIVALSFSLGLLLPMLCLGNINIFVENLSTMRYKDDANVWIASFEDAGGAISAKEISSLLEDSTLEIRDYAISAYKSGTVEINGAQGNEFVNYLTKDGAAFENFRRIDGSLELAAGAHICLVEQGFAEEHGGLRTGDKVTLFGDEYTIGGIFSSFHYYGKILLPLPDGGQEAEPGVTISTAYYWIARCMLEQIERGERRKTDEELCRQYLRMSYAAASAAGNLRMKSDIGTEYKQYFGEDIYSVSIADTQCEPFYSE